MQPSQSYGELVTLYNELEQHLHNTPLSSEHRKMVSQLSALGKGIFHYDKAKIEAISQDLSKQQALQALINDTKQAREALNESAKYINKAEKVANALDKVLEQLAKLV